MMILMMVQKTGTAGETMTFASSLRATLRLLACELLCYPVALTASQESALRNASPIANRLPKDPRKS